jgi:DNA-binding MarR family transcriptional regulator
MLDHLAALGIVERTRSQLDRRVVTNRLTDKGRRLLADKDADYRRKWAEVFAGLDDDELATGTVVLRRLAQLYDDI